MKIPAYARSDRQLWTPRLVRNAMPEALRIFRAIPSRIGPTDLSAMSLDVTDGYFEEDDRPRPTRIEITRAEYVLVGFPDEDGRMRPAWLNGAIQGYPDQQRTLSRWAVWASYGKRDREGVPQTEEEFARDLRMSLSTMKRYVDFGAMTIAQGLNEAGLQVWETDPPKRKNRTILHASGTL